VPQAGAIEQDQRPGGRDQLHFVRVRAHAWELHVIDRVMGRTMRAGDHPQRPVIAGEFGDAPHGGQHLPRPPGAVPGEEVRVQALVAAPRQRRARAQAVNHAAGPDHRIRRAEQRGLPDQRGIPGVGGVKAHADDTVPLLACGIPLGDDGAGQPIQAGRQNSHDIGGQERGHQQVAVLGEGAPLPAGEPGLPGHGLSITRPPSAIHPVFRRANVRIVADGPVAADGVPIPIRSGGQQWLVSWHPPPEPPDGTRHGAEGVCVTADGDVVVISPDGIIWDLPAGRPEPGESWEQTLRREMDEEACATVTGARLLGFTRGQCLTGPERGTVLVRSVWRADVELRPWEARFEIADRRVVPPATVEEALLLGSHPFAAIIRRELAEAALVT
jgi:ADP-ribose pyrophosphatase YjhB (NUDIX family)